MMDRMVTLPPALQERLTVEDDPTLWEQVLKTLAEDALTIEPVKHGSALYAEVGVCSHWLRPHQSRWTAAGGFAYPTGYGDGDGGGLPVARVGLPRLDWSLKLLFIPTSGEWVVPTELPTKRFNSIRVAIPSRTTRHRQAAVHTLWSPRTLDARRKLTALYGFRNSNGIWELKAHFRQVWPLPVDPSVRTAR